jgi:glycosyltransferase involved in cell wall biosynthesis
LRDNTIMKLLIQIPCLNEEGSIGRVLDNLPREIEGIDKIEALVIDDGSTDNTVEEALQHGVTHILRSQNRQGLARAFRAGIEECLRLGADIIVNTDGDNQYRGDDIPRLVRPIVRGEVDFVIGIRDIASIKHFSVRKKLLQLFGSWVVRRLSSTKIRDVTSGFRAFSRTAAASLDLVTDFTHTLETIIALGKERVPLAQVSISTNERTRDSRLFSSIYKYMTHCTADIVRIYIRYESLKTFASLGTFFMLLGIASGIYYLVDRLVADGRSFVALAFFSLFLISGLLFVVLGFLGDGIACNRRMLRSVTRYIREMKASENGRDFASRRFRE